MKPEALPALTSLRFFAAGAIVFFHLGTSGLAPWGAIPALANGVSLFFVLSGFILTYNYGDLTDVRRFYLTRFARIWPLHIATLLMILFLLPRLGLWAADERGFPILVTNVLLLQSWVPSGAYAYSFNGVSWSISAELFFYAVFPLLVRVRRVELLVLALALVTLAVVGYGHVFGASSKGSPPGLSWTHVILHFPPIRLLEFTIGIAAARMFLRRRPRSGDTTALEVAAVCLALVTVAATARVAGSGMLGLWVSQSGAALVFAAAIYVLALGQGGVSRMLFSPILVFLGEISFATYMVHQIMIRYVVEMKLASLWGTGATIVAALLAAYGTSYVLWMAVEVPAKRGILALARSLVSLNRPSREKTPASEPEPDRAG